MTGLERYIGGVLDGKYRLERLLGQGGMGAVYLATHLGTERPVALKLIVPQFMRNEEFVERFKREARAAGRLRHPNVVDVTDFGFSETDGGRVAYLVMEYLDGCTLGDVLAEEKRLPLEWTLDILEQVCSAVDEAHQQGVVHRDLKPDNIWLEPNRLGGYRVKVLDFGIAKMAEAGDHTAPAAAPAQPPGGPPRPGDAARPNPTAHEDAPSPLDAVQASLARAAASLHAASRQHTPARASSPGDPQGEESATQLYTPAAASPAGDAAAEEPGTLIFGGTPGGAEPAPPARDEEEEPGTMLLLAPRTPPPSREGGAAQTTAAAPSARATRLADGPDRTRRFDPGTAVRDDERPARGTGDAAATSALTRVGSIMGTPLYMSPEQCRGERLDSRSDVYSLGVIAYQMLAGETPFTGDMVSVMRHHMTDEPAPLREQVRKVPKGVARIVMAALAKDPAARPQSAAAFANSLRANSEGVGSLYRRAFALYSEHFPKFLKLSLLAHVPVIALTLVTVFFVWAEHAKALPKWAILAGVITCALLQIVANFLAAAVISGVTTLLVAQMNVAPLRPVELRTGFAVLRRRWRPFLNTSLRITFRIMLGFILCFIPGLVISMRYAFYAPVVLMEGLEKKAARLRSRELAARSWRRVIVVMLLQFAVPMIMSAVMSRFSISAQRSGAGLGTKVSTNFSGLVNIFILPLMSIVPSLLYLRMRQMGGETLHETLMQIESVDETRSDWQRRMRSRLSGYTPQARSRSGQSAPTGGPRAT